MDLADKQYSMLRLQQAVIERLSSEGASPQLLDDLSAVLGLGGEVLQELVTTRELNHQRQSLENLSPGCGFLNLPNQRH